MLFRNFQVNRRVSGIHARHYLLTKSSLSLHYDQEYFPKAFKAFENSRCLPSVTCHVNIDSMTYKDSKICHQIRHIATTALSWRIGWEQLPPGSSTWGTYRLEIRRSCDQQVDNSLGYSSHWTLPLWIFQITSSNRGTRNSYVLNIWFLSCAVSLLATFTWSPTTAQNPTNLSHSIYAKRLRPQGPWIAASQYNNRDRATPAWQHFHVSVRAFWFYRIPFFRTSYKQQASSGSQDGDDHSRTGHHRPVFLWREKWSGKIRIISSHHTTIQLMWLVMQQKQAQASLNQVSISSLVPRLATLSSLHSLLMNDVVQGGPRCMATGRSDTTWGNISPDEMSVHLPVSLKSSWWKTDLGLQVLDNVIMTRWKVLPREQCQGMQLNNQTSPNVS
jgi:hypothetical protein